MADPPTALTGHLAHDLLHTLADLDRGNKLLGISSLLKSGDTIEWQSIRHPVGFAVMFLLQGVLVYLIRHIMLRTAGTLMVRSKTQDHRISTTGSSNHGIFGFLREALASPRRLRRDVFLGLGYNILYSLPTDLISGFSSSMRWTILSHIIAASLLSSLHLRWTCTILSLKRPAQRRIVSLPRKGLILPSLVYGLAYQVTAKLPTYIAKMGDGYRSDEIGSIAVADAVVLIAAFGLRMLVLYPAFAAYIYTEIKQVGRRDSGSAGSNGQERSLGFGAYAYGRACRLCFRRTALWFGLLHLQMVFVLAGFEILITPIIYRMIF